MSLKHDIAHRALSGVTDRDTSKNYRPSVPDFCAWAKTKGIKTIKDLKGRRVDVINQYSKYLQERGYSSGTVHTYLAPVCKGLGVGMQQVAKPKRRAGDVTKRRVGEANLRGRREAQQDRYARSVALSKATGARRAELTRMTYRDLMHTDESGYRCAAVWTGKGGKDTLQRLTPAQAAICDVLVRQAEASGIDLDSRILTTTEISDHIPYHTYRAERAREAYELYAGRIAAEGKDKLIGELIDRWNVLNPDKDRIYVRQDGRLATARKSRAKTYIKALQEADKPYKLRGDNRRRALAEGRPAEYDRLALLAVSVFELAHWRLDVTVTNYML